MLDVRCWMLVKTTAWRAAPSVNQHPKSNIQHLSSHSGFAVFSVAAFTEWPLNVRVGENSPSLWPTMFSVTYTGMNFLPLWQASVCPTNSGSIVERRDQVLMTFFSFFTFIASTFFSRWVSTNGPFFTERPISFSSYRFFALRLTMNLSVRLLFRVLKPRVGWPQGVTGLRPPEVLPSPPPCGWSTGFIDTPRLCGILPSHRLRPALPSETFS